MSTGTKLTQILRRERASRTMDDPTVINLLSDLDHARALLKSCCDHGYVADLKMKNGKTITAVLIGLSSTSLILDQWDGLRHGSAGNPFVLELQAIAEVIVP